MLFVCKARSPHRMAINCSASQSTAVLGDRLLCVASNFGHYSMGLPVKWVELTECQHPVDDFYTFPEDFQFNLS